MSIMRDFNKVSPEIWASERFRGLNDDGKTAQLYLLTCPHVSSIGCFRLPPAYACADLGWERPKYEAVLKALEAAELVVADHATQEVMILRWFKHNPVTNFKHAVGAKRLVDKIVSAGLRDRVVSDLAQSWETWNAAHPSAEFPVSTSLLELERRRKASAAR